MIAKASELYDKLLSIDKTQYDKVTKAQKKKVEVQNKPHEDEDDLPPMLPLEGDEEIKPETEETIAERIKINPRKRKITGTRLKILTPNKLLTRLPVLLAGNNSYKLKNEIRQILYLLYQHNEIAKKVYNNLIKSL